MLNFYSQQVLGTLLARIITKIGKKETREDVVFITEAINRHINHKPRSNPNE